MNTKFGGNLNSILKYILVLLSPAIFFSPRGFCEDDDPDLPTHVPGMHDLLCAIQGRREKLWQYNENALVFYTRGQMKRFNDFDKCFAREAQAHNFIYLGNHGPDPLANCVFSEARNRLTGKPRLLYHLSCTKNGADGYGSSRKMFCDGKGFVIGPRPGYLLDSSVENGKCLIGLLREELDPRLSPSMGLTIKDYDHPSVGLGVYCKGKLTDIKIRRPERLLGKNCAFLLPEIDMERYRNDLDYFPTLEPVLLECTRKYPGPPPPKPCGSSEPNYRNNSQPSFRSYCKNAGPCAAIGVGVPVANVACSLIVDSMYDCLPESHPAIIRRDDAAYFTDRYRRMCLTGLYDPDGNPNDPKNKMGFWDRLIIGTTVAVDSGAFGAW